MVCNMPKFIYVFGEKDRDQLISLGYELLKQDKAQNIFVFVNQEKQKFSKLELPYLVTDTLTF